MERVSAAGVFKFLNLAGNSTKNCSFFLTFSLILFPNSPIHLVTWINTPATIFIAEVTGSWLPPLKTDCTVQWVIGKIFNNFFSFQATEMVFTSKWGRIQPEIQICLHEDSSCLRAARALRATLNHSAVVYVDACWNPFLIAMGMHESHKGYKK